MLAGLAVLTVSLGTAQQAPSSTASQGIALPLVSVGRQVGWKIPPEDYRLFVPQGAAGRVSSVELFSPETNRDDYANQRNRASYYGDELYGKNASLSTAFRLANPAGHTITSQSFGTGTRHSFAQLYQGTLEPGFYGLSVSSLGNGKNAFQLRASAGVRVEASQFAVNARGQYDRDQLVAFLDLGQSAVGKTVRLENYDADGAQEMVLTLVDPQGRRRALTISGDTQWASDSLRVSADTVGTWKVLARILPTTRQFSNSVALRFGLEGQPLFVRIPGFAASGAPVAAPTPPAPTPPASVPVTPAEPETGTLTVDSITTSCGSSVPVEANFRLDGRRYTTPVSLKLAPGKYTLQPEAVPGAKAEPVRVSISKDGSSVAALRYTVESRLTLEPETLALEVGQTAVVSATASTAYPVPVPMTVRIVLPDGLEPIGPNRLEGTASSGKSLSLTVPVRAVKAVQNGVVHASLEPNCGVSAQASVRIVQPAELKLEKTADRSTARPGEAVRYTITVSNVGGAIARNLHLTDVMPQGVNGANLTERFDLEPGAKKTFTLPATVTSSLSGTITNTARIEWNRKTLSASADLRVEVPAVIAPPPPAVAPPAPATNTPAPPAPPAPAQLKLEKTVNRTITLGPEDIAAFTITVTNAGGSPARGIALEDRLPAGLVGNDLSERFDLEPGETRRFRVPVRIAANAARPGVTSTIENTARLVWNNQTITSSASLQVTAPAEAMVPPAAPPPVAPPPVAPPSVEPPPAVTPPVAAPPAPPAPVVTALPPQRRESQLIVLGKLGMVPAQGYVVLSDRLPVGAAYVRGSSRQLVGARFDANTPTNAAGEAISDPLVSGDRLFWIVPLGKADTYAVTYRVSHEGAITVPHDPAILLIQPAVRSAGDPRATSATSWKLEPDSPLGQRIGQGEVQLVQGDAQALEALRRATPFGQPGTQAAPRPVGGPASSLRLSLRRATNDPADQPELIVEAFDQNGLPAADAFVTLALNLDRGGTPSPIEPAIPDAAPERPGYQVRLEDGVGRLPLANLGGALGDNIAVTAVTAEVRVTNANGTVSSSRRFSVTDISLQAPDPLAPDRTNVTATDRPVVAAGVASAQVNLGLSGTPAFSVSGGLRGFVRGEVFNDWMLTAAVNWQASYDGSLALSGSLLPPANPYDRFPLLGDASQLGSDVRSSEGTYVRLENGPSYAMYGQVSPGFRGLLSAYSPNFNGFQTLVRGDGFSLNGFAALVANANRRSSQRGDGTSLYRLPNAPIQPSSERVTITVYDRNNPSLKLSERLLTRGTDYALDDLSGTVQLARPLLPSDAAGNPQFLEVAYSSEADAAPRELRFGAQASLGSDAQGLQLNATALHYRPGVNPLSLFGVGAAFRAGGLQLGLEGTFSGQPGNGGALGLAGQFSYTAEGFQAQARYQELFPGYIDPTSAAPSTGRALQAGLTANLSPSLSLSGNVSHNQNFTTGGADDSASLQVRNDFGVLAAALGVYGRLEYAGGAALPTGPGRGAWLTAGVELPVGPVRFGALQRVPLTDGTYGDTTLSADYAITASFGVRLSDTISYEPGGLRQQIGFGVRGSFANSELLRTLLGNHADVPAEFGSTNVSAGYELDTLSGDAGRARLGLETTIPLGSNWSAQVGGEAALGATGSSSGSLNLGLRYADEGVRGGARAQYAIQPAGIKQVYTLGVAGQVAPGLVVSPSLEYAILPNFEALPSGASVRDGGRFSLAAAWRGDNLTVLTNHTGRFGLYAPNGDELQGEVQFDYNAAQRFELRSGAAYRVSSGLFTGQLSAGATYFFTDTLGAGASAAYLFQPVTGTSKIALGLEASLRLLPGFTVSAGFNFLGYDSGFSFTTAPGFYVRFDLSFDERTFGLSR